MAAEMRLYRVTVIGSNAERQRGKVVDEVTVKVGTKWLTDNRDCRYYKAPSKMRTEIPTSSRTPCTGVQITGCIRRNRLPRTITGRRNCSWLFAEPLATSASTPR